MDQHDTQGTQRDGRFLDTVALGSMLVFASVMPPICQDPVLVDAAGVLERREPGWSRSAGAPNPEGAGDRLDS